MQDKLDHSFPDLQISDMWGSSFVFFVQDEVDDEDKGKESEGGAAGVGWGSDDKVSMFSMSISCGNIA